MSENLPQLSFICLILEVMTTKKSTFEALVMQSGPRYERRMNDSCTILHSDHI